jgi:arylsulfatase A-like enzyme
MRRSLPFYVEISFHQFLLVLIILPFIVACDGELERLPSVGGTKDSFSIAAGMTLHRDAPGVLENDAAMGSGLKAQLVSNPRHGDLVLQDDGSFTYVPRYKFSGHDEFWYQVINGESISEPVQVSIGYPNVIVILTDDLGLGDLGIYNEEAVAQTPNLNALAEAGIAFSNAHSTAAACSPSRYSVLTGNYPYRGRISSGIWNTYEPSTMIIPGQVTLGTLFNEAGYQTGFIGKMHNGDAFWNKSGTDYTKNHREIDFTRSFDRGPLQFGFDYSFLLPGGVASLMYAYFENDRLVRYDSNSGAYKPFNSNETAHRSFVRTQGWNSTHNGGLTGASGWAIDNYDSRKAGSILTRKAIEFMEHAISQGRSTGIHTPFFLYYATSQIHKPYSPPEYFNPKDSKDDDPSTEGDRVAGVSNVSERTDMIVETDLMVGAIVDFLKQKGQLDNTLIVLSSDNGPVWWGEPEVVVNVAGAENGVPFRGMKGDIYEAGHRVPLLARWGDGVSNQSVILPGGRSKALVGLQDLASTFYSLLGRQRPFNQANDSKSLMPVLLGDRVENYPPRDHLIVQGSPDSVEEKRGNVIDRAFYKYDSDNELWKLSVISNNSDPVAGIVWKELYNLSTDPGEANNLLDQDDYQELREAMKAEYLHLIIQPQTVISFK